MRILNGVLLASLLAAPAAKELRGQMVLSQSRVGGSYIGVGLAEVDAGRAKDLKLREERGVEITWVEEGSPAEKAGLKKGDVVLEFNGQRVEGMEQFSRFVRETPVGRDAKLLVSRDGTPQTIAVKVGARKATGGSMSISPKLVTPGELPEIMRMPETMRWPDFPRGTMSWRNSMLGIEGESLSGQLADYFGVKDGVLVRSVAKGSPAEKAGIKAGDVITKVDDSVVTSPADVSSALRLRGERKTVQVLLTRERKPVTLSVTMEDGWADQDTATRPLRRL